MDILLVKIKLETIVPNLPAFKNQHTVLSDIEIVVISNIGVHSTHRTAEKQNFLTAKSAISFSDDIFTRLQTISILTSP